MTVEEPEVPGVRSTDAPGTRSRRHPIASAPRPRTRALPPPGRRDRFSVRRWALWGLPHHVLAFVLALDAAAVVVIVLAVAAGPFRGVDVGAAGVLVLGAAVHVELARRIERVREAASGVAPYIDVKSMWSFAAVVLLPLGPALVVAGFTFVWWWLRVSRRPPPHRWLFSFATVVVATAAASAVLSVAPDVDHLYGGPAGLGLLAAAVAVRWAINHGLVVVVITLTAPSIPARRRLGSATDHLVGFGALTLGVALACLVHVSPWLVPVLLVPVVGLNRGLLLPQFARAARTDPKTGLANATHWRDRAAREFARVSRKPPGSASVGVLMVDLDEFKAVNDRHGHLIGDAVLRAVADLLRTETRAYDVVGRFGGEEFLVLLPDTDLDEVIAVGNRLRRRIGDMEIPVRGARVSGLTASAGAAAHPAHGEDVDEVLTAADGALYTAKRAGRNRVEIASG